MVIRFEMGGVPVGITDEGISYIFMQTAALRDRYWV
jgi:hypothetical protein